MAAPPEAGLPAFSFPVERGAVRDFAVATAASHPHFVEAADPTVPPTFLTSAQRWSGPEHEVLRTMGLDWSTLLHGGQRYEFPGGPPRAGDLLEGRQRLVGVHEVDARSGRLRVIEFAVDFRRAGRVVAREHHTTLQRLGRAGAAAGGRAAAAPESGLPLPTLVPEPVSLTDVVRYQGASGDLNPIHHDPEVARGAGYPGPFSVGMLHAGVLASHLASLVGPAHVRDVAVRFRAQVWPGDRLIYGGCRLPSAPGEQLDRFELWVRRDDGATVVTGSAVAVPVDPARSTADPREEPLWKPT